MISRFASSLPRRLAQLEDGLVVALLLILIGLAGLQILLRNLVGTSLPWADPLLRAMVLWLALGGAAIATRENRQITVDVFSRRFRGRWQGGLTAITHGFAAAVCGLLCWHGVRFLRDEMQYASEWVLGMPSWLPVLPIPLFLGLIGIRYALFCVISTWKAVRG